MSLSRPLRMVGITVLTVFEERDSIMKLNVSRARRGESLPMTCPSRVSLLTSDEVVLERSQFAHDLSRVSLQTSDESGPGEESVCP